MSFRRAAFFLWALFFLLALKPAPQRIVYADPIIRVAELKPLQPIQMPPVSSQEPLETVLTISPPNTYSNDYMPGQCVWFVAGRIPVPNSMGNADQWDDYAYAHGIAVSSVPRVGAVAQTDAYGLGHVGLVVAIGDGTVTVDEMNWNGPFIEDERTTSVSDWNYILF